MSNLNYIVNPPSTHAIEELQELGDYGNNIKIAVIDGAVDTNHPLLALSNVNADKANTCSKHGTAVCSLIAGQSVGLAPRAEVITFSVFYEDDKGQIQGCSERKLSKAIDRARLAGSDIINISGASISQNGLGSDELKQAVRACYDEGVLIIAAVGNDGLETETIPASIETVLAVGACDKQGAPAPFNNYGPKLRKKTLLASGIDMPVAVPHSNIALMSGSSFATPVVTGVCALLINIFNLHKRQKERVSAIHKILFETAAIVPVGKGQGRSSFSKMRIPALLNKVKQELSPHQHIHQKRKNTMSNSNSAVEPQELDVIPQHDNETRCDANQPISEGAASTGDLIPQSLSLPTIDDPAPNHHVHLKPSIVEPQGSDAVSMRSQEKVFLIGTIGYDFGTEARLDYFTQVMGDKKGHPFDPVEMGSHLKKDENIEQSNALIWTLKVDGIPVYAIEPENQFAVLQYVRLVNFLYEQETKNVERVSVAGIVTGETRLFNGQIVPRVSPVLRGMFNWTSTALAELVMGTNTQSPTASEHLTNFLNRIYYELRNRGATSQERAINYAATNAYQMKEVFDDAIKENLFLNKISAEASPVSRPDSDCWDVVLEFFNPKERLTAARKLYRYTVDVSDVMPVTVGTLRSWNAF